MIKSKHKLLHVSVSETLNVTVRRPNKSQLL